MKKKINLFNDLTRAQEKAITYHNGPLLIIAGPGSGKTEVISGRAAYLILSGLTKPENLLVTTFTEKAALELKDRIQAKLPDINVELMQVSTIHSLCYSLLNEFRPSSPFPRGFTVLDEAGQLLFIYSRRKDLGLGEIMKGRESDFFAEVQRTYNLASEELVNPSKFSEYCEIHLKNADENEKALWEERTSIAKSYERYLEILQSANATDFSNLQRQTLNMLKTHKGVLREIQERYTDILIDEYQDTNAVQDIILTKIAKPHMNLAVVGDDDQSIYRFRGATVKNILNFDKKHKPIKIVKLEDNFRSLMPIIDHSSRLIKHNIPRKDKYLRCIRKDWINDIFLVLEETAPEEAKSVVSILKRLKSNGIIKQFKDVAILLRSVRSYAGPYLEFLREAQIPSILIKDGRFFERDDIAEIYYLFIFLGASKPWGDKFVRCSIMQFTKKTQKALEKFKEDLISIKHEKELRTIGVSNKNDRDKLLELIELKRNVQEQKHYSILEILYEILRITEYFKKAEEEKNIESIKNIGILTKNIGVFDKFGGTSNLYPFLSYMKLLRQSTLNSFSVIPDDAVQIMTVHQAKGLEFPVVIIGAAMEGRFPTYARRNKYEIPFKLMKSGKPEIADHHVVDERKLFYVAGTRTRDLLMIGTSNVVNKRGGGPSRFIKELLGNNMDEALERSRRILESPLKVEPIIKKTYEPRKRLSYSQLAYFLQCPIRFKYFVIDEIEPPIPLYLYFGTSVHRALELIHNKILEGKTIGEENVEEFVERTWIPSIRIDEEKEKFYKDAAFRQISTYIRNHNFTFNDLLRTEEAFSLDLEDVVISGKIDLIRVINGQYKEIVDFKTSESKTSPRDQTNLQMNLYAIGAEHSLGLKIGKCSVHFLANNIVETMEWKKELKSQAKSYLADLINKIKKEEFRPRIEYCPFCDEFKNICLYYKRKDKKG